MQIESSNIDLEKKVDAYIKGRLNENEAQELWAELIKRPQYIDRLQTEVDLTRYHRQKLGKEQRYQRYWAWFTAAAAVLILGVGLNLLLTESLNNYTIEQIALRSNLATANVMRSGEPNFETVDSLLNLGFENAVNGKIDQALAIYEKVIAQYPNTPYAAKAYLNSGIIAYNRSEYESALKNLKRALPIIEQNNYILEQTYWYMGNALINLGEYRRAEEILQKAYQLNGIHAQRASGLLNRLNRELGSK